MELHRQLRDLLSSQVEEMLLLPPKMHEALQVWPGLQIKLKRSALVKSGERRAAHRVYFGETILNCKLFVENSHY